MVGAELHMRAEEGARIRLEETRNATGQASSRRKAHRPRPVQAGKTPQKSGRSTRRQNSLSRARRSSGLLPVMMAGVDGADRGADDPVRLDARLVQGLIDAALIGAERAAALEHEHDLAVIIGADLR